MDNVELLDEIQTSQQYKIPNDLVHNNPDATVDNALDQIVDLTMSAHTAPNEEEYFTPGNVDYYLSLALMEHVQNLEPIKQKRLVEFICGLQKRTARDPSTGEPLKSTGGDILWTDLPSFGYTEYETWDSHGGDYTGIAQYAFSPLLWLMKSADPCSLDLQGESRQRWAERECIPSPNHPSHTHTHITYEPPQTRETTSTA